jgi:VWFA-related protein
VDRYRGQSSALLDAATEPDPSSSGAAPDDVDSLSALEEFLHSANGPLSDLANINRVNTTKEAFEAIAYHVAGIPGRKNLVWISASFPLTIGFDGETLPPINREVRAFTPEVERAARAINQANMAIYPVDARGLMPSNEFSAAQRFDARRAAPRSAPKLFPDRANFDTMTLMAERTGGRAFYDTNDLAGAVRAAISDAESSYLIAFYPDHGRWDGKFHELKVRVSTPHTELRYRQGYFATSEPADNAADTKAALDAAAWSPVESTGLGIQTTVNAVEPLNKRILKVSTLLDSHEVEFTEAKGRWAAGLEMLFLQLAAGNTTVSGEQKTVRLNLEKPRYDAVLKDGLRLTGYLTMAPTTRSLRIVVRDSSSGALGSVSIPVEKFLAADSSVRK